MSKSNLEQIVKELEGLANKKNVEILLPTPIQIYSIGSLLFRMDGGGGKSIIRNSTTHSEVKEEDELKNHLLAAYKDLMESLPVSYLKNVFQMYHKALAALFLESNNNNITSVAMNGGSGDGSGDNEDDLQKNRNQAIETLCGLFCHSPFSCQVAYSKDFISTLACIYDKYIMEESSSSSSAAAAKELSSSSLLLRQKQNVLSLISCLLLDGLFVSKTSNQGGEGGGGPIEEEIMNAIQVMEEQSTDCLRDLQQWEISQSTETSKSLETAINELPFDEDTIHQREYILNMLESARLTEKTTKHGSTNGIPKKAPKQQQQQNFKATTVSASDELERRIQQVKQIIPDAGEGFIETALSLFQGDIERTVSTLLIHDPAEYPPALRFLDRSLPRRKKDRSQDEAAEAREARELVKERVALEEKQEQEKYRALLYVTAQQDREQEMTANEYDDDYDDQYDEVDVKLGDADNGLYDFEQIKIYNKVAREDEAEDSFWEANRNTNRRVANQNNGGKNASSNATSGEGGSNTKQYRGPDKIKGGRIVGPDGKIVRKQGPGKKKNKQTNGGQQQQQQQQQQAANNKNDPGNQRGGKPKTKPRSNNRVNRQRDRKQKAQGTFGVES